MADDSKDLTSLLKGIQVDKVGVVSLEDFNGTSVAEIAEDLLTGARSVIVLAMEVFPELVKHLKSGRKVGELVLRDLFNRNADIVNGHLDWESYKLVRGLHELGFQGVPLPAGDAPFDARFIEGMLSYKACAVIAGMGRIGWNTMLLTPEFGVRQRLACIVTNALPDETASSDDYNPCSVCGGACVKVCPVQAIKPPQDGETSNIDRFLCNTYLSNAGGCSECLRVCPADRLFITR